ncbi:MAG: hybrid sensor histidine kinase/response regulator [Bacteroidales bacterium]|nr:hybrid sensor histidine kinase/response regulator [Bacteroidales bacterium]MCF8344097.1 hybrid sensor histidine kinase/response regulator [Bacteroidales bacterium]MCF8352145.1 hybrid sensor histidine kinase/response regulator [Bacteroidales bacterium]MCF8375770.1 hybrid sensor histidine kinase/response regulator [Bacteroidales bacterium]MCF8402236.1 hybrid sensor histidine kinase/response regulator [Bacteroidales bacterium]
MAENGENKILIVDDIPKNIQILGNILKNKSYHISYAQSGKEALTLIDVNDFDLILLDIMMPGMDGYEVCRYLKKDEKTRDIPIIFLTAKADKESVVNGFRSGAEDYLTKPFNADELLARVDTHLALKNQKAQLRQMNKTLEDKVAERTQQLEEANSQLRSLERAKSDFLSIISHELRTPLNGIQGLIELLGDESQTSEQSEYLDYLKEASDRLVKFSEIAILVTSLKLEKYKLSYSPQRVAYLIDNILEKFRHVADEKNVSIHTSIRPEDIKISLDFDLVRSSLEGLLDNALKFSPENGRVDICAYLEGQRPVLEFRDEGPGFSEEVLSKMFHYFNSNDVMNSEGLGLSVAAVKLVMDAHGGKIDIKNRNKKGAVIKLIF